jgi:hypothetical protein
MNEEQIQSCRERTQELKSDVESGYVAENPAILQACTDIGHLITEIEILKSTQTLQTKENKRGKGTACRGDSDAGELQGETSGLAMAIGNCNRASEGSDAQRPHGLGRGESKAITSRLMSNSDPLSHHPMRA